MSNSATNFGYSTSNHQVVYKFKR